jgi:hypothetical protein
MAKTFANFNKNIVALIIIVGITDVQQRNLSVFFKDM